MHTKPVSTNHTEPCCRIVLSEIRATGASAQHAGAEYIWYIIIRLEMIYIIKTFLKLMNVSTGPG